MSRLDYCKYELVGDCYDWKNDNCDGCNIFKAYCEGERRAKKAQNNAVPTHGRLIDADALLEAVDRIGLTCDGGVDINDLEGTIQEMAGADRPHGDWTPVTEQLPKIDETLPLCDQISDEVLGTDTYGNIRHVYLTNCGYLKPTFCTVEEGMSVDIVAWMPLPESYEEVSDGKD